MADDGRVGSGLFVGFIAGSIIGSLIGLLYAPKPGKELRGEILDMSNDYLEDTEAYIKNAKVKYFSFFMVAYFSYYKTGSLNK